MPQMENLVDKLASQLPESVRVLLAAVQSEAASSGVQAFLAGGTVRDLLLGRDVLDVDIAIEGDAVAIARKVAEATGARLVKTTAFGTATLKMDGAVVDLATARSESYAKPGALPKVMPSTIEEDLRRRDFTVNAMAYRISDGELLDPADGLRDLKARLVRVLHDGSFKDDATRIFRAVRYEARFGFRIEEHTLDLLRRDVRFLDTISGTRIRQELTRCFAEREPERSLLRMQELQVLQSIHPELSFGEKQAAAFARLTEMSASSAAMWAVLAWNSGQLADVCRRLALTRRQAEAVAAVEEARALAGRIAPGMRRSEIAHLIDPLPLPTSFALAAMTGSPALAGYVTSLRNVKPILRGDDVIEAGVPRGPDVARVLAMLRAAKLDGEVMTREDEERLVEQFLARERIGLA